MALPSSKPFAILPAMGRLPTFNYRSPFFYMITLKKRKGLPVFSRITKKNEDDIRSSFPTLTTKYLSQRPDAFVEVTPITKALLATISEFSHDIRCVEPITTVAIMPDHIHMLIRIINTGTQMPLGNIVALLMRKLSHAYWNAIGQQQKLQKLNHVFEHEWHDWIVMHNNQLKAFRHYILTNPFRAWRRMRCQAMFMSSHKVKFLNRTWHAYGNDMLLESPVIVPLKGHRQTKPESPAWNELVAAAARIGPGGAGISTFMSPLEKTCGNAIAKAGGGMIVLSPEGFGERWHPSEKKEKFCLEGKMLFLSLYEPMARQLTNRELHERCHEMGEVVARGLGHSTGTGKLSSRIKAFP